MINLNVSKINSQKFWEFSISQAHTQDFANIKINIDNNHIKPLK